MLKETPKNICVVDADHPEFISVDDDRNRDKRTSTLSKPSKIMMIGIGMREIASGIKLSSDI